MPVKSPDPISLPGNIFPKGGHPVIFARRDQLPEAATPDEAAQMARAYMGMGLDGMKLFTGAYMGDNNPSSIWNRPSRKPRSMWRMRKANRYSPIRKTRRVWRL